MRTVRYHVGATLDGFIAHSDHTVDGFLTEGDHITDFMDALKRYDTVVMGRHTYDFGLRLGVTNPYPWMRRQCVVSRTMTSPDPAVEVEADPAALVRRLQEEPGSDIYLCGGGALASTLLEAGLIDEVCVKLYPVVFGEGVPMFARPVAAGALRLRDTRVYDSGVLLLTYSVGQRSSTRPADAAATM